MSRIPSIYKGWPLFIAATALLLLSFSPPVSALAWQERDLPPMSREQVLENLERGIIALRVIDRNEEAEHLTRILREYAQAGRQRERPESSEREVAQEQLEVFRLAHHAFREAERPDAAELMEQIIHARELGLEGNREAAAEAHRKAPSREQQIEFLMAAAGIWDEFGHEGKAATIRELAEQMQRRTARRDAPPEDRRGPGDDRIIPGIEARHVQLMRTGLAALREANRPDAADLLEKAIRSYEVKLENRHDEEAAAIRKAAPELGAQVELLAFAANLWGEFGNEKNAASLNELAQYFREHWAARQGESSRERQPDAMHEIHQTIRQLNSRIEALERRLEEQSQRR